MIFGLFVCGHNCIGMGNYLLKHFLSEKEPKEFKLTVHTSGESLIKMNSDMSVRVKNWENIPSVRITKSLMHYGAIANFQCTMGPRQEALTVGPSGLPSTFSHILRPTLPSMLRPFPNGGVWFRYKH